MDEAIETLGTVGDATAATSEADDEGARADEVATDTYGEHDCNRCVGYAATAVAGTVTQAPILVRRCSIWAQRVASISDGGRRAGNSPTHGAYAGYRPQGFRLPITDLAGLRLKFVDSVVSLIDHPAGLTFSEDWVQIPLRYIST